MQLVLKLYAALFAALFAIIFVAQILGFLGLYYQIIAIPLTLSTALLAFWGYQRWQLDLQPQANSSRLIFMASFVLVFFVFVLRMLLWPHSELGQVIPSDFFTYHGVKALELAQSGSMWNLAIPYGDYPNGYESLAAFGLLLTGDIRTLGFFHALIFLLIWLTVALLLIRYAAIPLNIALFASVMLCFIPSFYSLLLLIGKNDSLLSLTILLAILHAPLPNRHFHPLGLAYATMLSLAIKASGLYILFYLWGLVMLFWGLAWREGKAKSYFHPLSFLLCMGLMFTGGLWVIRNYLLMGEVLTSEVRSFFNTSIGTNLFNPLLYNSGEESLYLGLALLLILLLALISYKRWNWASSLLLIVLALTFVFTPLSAFHTIQSTVLHVEWRYFLHGLLLLLIVLIASLWPFFASRTRFLPLISLSLSIAILIALNPLDFFAYDASRAEQFTDPSGSGASVYDEVAKLETGLVYLEYGDWFALSYANPQLRFTQGGLYPLGRGDIYPAVQPDYAFFIPQNRNAQPSFGNLGAEYEWEIIYEDATGRLYRRMP